jgi:type II secretory pathway pseudopilin PulG
MKNQKGISLIALIITIIVIIILAAIVIGSAVRTPESANWAKFCGNYSEIQSAVATQSAEIYGKLMLDPDVAAKPSLGQVRLYVVTQAHSASAAWPDGVTAGQTYPTELVGSATQTIDADANQLGLAGFDLGDDWSIDKDGVLFYLAGVPNPNDNNAKYTTPTTKISE